MEIFSDLDGWALLLRWVHILAGITWIGLLYYFNFVQVPFFAEIEPEIRTVAIRKLGPRALAWFRSASIWRRRAGCFSASPVRSRILRSTCCSASSAFSFSLDNVCLPSGPAFSRLRREMSTLARGRSLPGGADWARQESNLHATGYEPDALTVELRAREFTQTSPGGGVRPP